VLNPKVVSYVRFAESAEMKKITATLLMVVAGALSCAAQDSSDWINYTSSTGHYSVLIPKQPQLMTQEGKTSSGNKVPQYVAVVEDSSATYMLAYFDYTTASSFSFDKARDGMLANVKGTLVSEKPISLGRYPGRDVKISGNNSGVEFLAHVKYYDVNKRVYMVQFIFNKTNDTPETDAKAKKFFDSFKVVNTP